MECTAAEEYLRVSARFFDIAFDYQFIFGVGVENVGFSVFVGGDILTVTAALGFIAKGGFCLYGAVL